MVEREDETAQVGVNFESFSRESLRCRWKAVCRSSLQNQPWIDIFYWRESREVHVKSVPRGARPSHIGKGHGLREEVDQHCSSKPM